MPYTYGFSGAAGASTGASVSVNGTTVTMGASAGGVSDWRNIVGTTAGAYHMIRIGGVPAFVSHASAATTLVLVAAWPGIAQTNAAWEMALGLNAADMNRVIGQLNTLMAFGPLAKGNYLAEYAGDSAAITNVLANLGMTWAGGIYKSGSNTGFGTSTPSATWHFSATPSGAGIATSGVTDATVINRFQGSTVNIDFGVLSSGWCYIQGRLASDFATKFPLLLNPAGGAVSVGTSLSKSQFTVAGGASAAAPTLGATGYSAFISAADPSYGLMIGQFAGSGNTWLQAMRTDGTATAYDIQLQPSGGNVVTRQINPITDNGFGLGTGILRWNGISLTTSPSVTSDENDKLDREVLTADQAWAILDELEGFMFRMSEGKVETAYVDDPSAEPVEEQVTEEREVEETRTVYEETRAVIVTEKVRKQVPVFDDLPAFDIDGKPAMAPVLDARGNPIAGQFAQIILQKPRMHLVPARKAVRVIVSEGRRLHFGIIAQHLQKALRIAGFDPGDMAIWGLINPDDPKSRQWVRYDHLHTIWLVCLKSIRHWQGETDKRIAALEAK